MFFEVSFDLWRKRSPSHIFSDGFDISNRHFEFLGYSSSSLRDHSFWFVSPFTIGDMRWNAEAIRASLGDFSIIRDPNGNEISNDKTMKCPARYGARLAQAFRWVPCRKDGSTLCLNFQRNGALHKNQTIRSAPPGRH